jgi:hypothetical protein
MNSLEVYIRDQKLDEREAINQLQANGIISDNCVKAADVFGLDNWRAISFFIKQAKTK